MLMMQEQEFRELLTRYRDGLATEQEIAMLESRYLRWNEKDKLFHSEAELVEVDHDIWLALKVRLDLKEELAVPKRRIWPWSLVAAAAVATIVFGVWFFSAPSSNSRKGLSTYINNDVAPGRNGARITLANGKVIALSDLKSGVVIGHNRLAYTDGSIVAADVMLVGKDQQLTAATAKGQIYNFTLPDGTKVWLNADSKISFSQPFIKKAREIFLEGEAYFEVVKDERHPFIVAGNSQKVEVLGTHFNVNSYKDEPEIATTLLEGAVKVTSGNIQKVIKPGEQAVNTAGDIKVGPVNVDNVVDWKNGDFYLNHVNFKTAMRKIARWYDVDVVYDASVPDEIEAGGWLSRDKKLSEVLQSIEAAGQVRFKVEGKKIIVSNN